MSRMREWRSGAKNGMVYLYNHANDEHRMGNCEWLPKDGDLCLCVGHFGDYFHNYIALRQRDDGRWEKAGEFGAYYFGEKVANLDKRAFHLAQAGEPIEMTPNAELCRTAPRPQETARRFPVSARATCYAPQYDEGRNPSAAQG